MVSQLDDESPKFDDLDDPMAPGDDLAPLEPDMEFPDELPQEIEDLPVDGQQAPHEKEEAPTGDAEEPPLEQSAALPPYVAWAAALAGAVILLALALLHFIYFGTAIYLISIGLVFYGIWKDRETNTAYTVLLGCALIAVLTAVYCLWIELGRYHFNISAKQQASVSASIHGDRYFRRNTCLTCSRASPSLSTSTRVL